MQKLKNRSKEVVKDDNEQTAKTEDKEAKNAEKLAKIKLLQLFEQEGEDVLPEIREQMRKIKSRGLKQRFKKKLAEKFGQQKQDQNEATTSKLPDAPAARSKLEKKIQRKENGKKALNEWQKSEKIERPLKIVDEEEEAKLIKVRLT